jgi:hypothetical protein
MYYCSGRVDGRIGFPCVLDIEQSVLVVGVGSRRCGHRRERGERMVCCRGHGGVIDGRRREGWRQGRMERVNMGEIKDWRACSAGNYSAE